MKFHMNKDLNALETVFISRRIPFMKIRALPRGKQRAMHEPEQLVSVLPRVPSPETFIPVKVTNINVQRSWIQTKYKTRKNQDWH